MDKVYSRKGEWFCKVSEREFGSWPSKVLAQAGMATEQRRAAARAAASNVPRKEKGDVAT